MIQELEEMFADAAQRLDTYVLNKPVKDSTLKNENLWRDIKASFIINIQEAGVKLKSRSNYSAREIDGFVIKWIGDYCKKIDDLK
jgi:hypothetical protein